MEIRGRKRFRTRQERRQIVEETLRPGASVSVVARAHDVNANQVFSWRRQYREGWFDEPSEKATALVPVAISAMRRNRVQPRRQASKVAVRTMSGTIDIDLGHARVRIEGAADPECVRAAVEGLLR
jgi:transposase